MKYVVEYMLASEEFYDWNSEEYSDYHKAYSVYEQYLENVLYDAVRLLIVVEECYK